MLPGKLLATCLLLAATAPARCDVVNAAPPPSVTGNGELLIGAWEPDKPVVAVFRGIPFAAPPVARFRRADQRRRRPGLGVPLQPPAAAVMDYGLAFARHGDPDVAGRPVSPTYTRGQPGVQDLGTENQDRRCGRSETLRAVDAEHRASRHRPALGQRRFQRPGQGWNLVLGRSRTVAVSARSHPAIRIAARDHVDPSLGVDHDCSRGLG